jgi:prevent-host-death family protein
MDAITMGDLRRDLARVANRVAFGGERLIVERHGKPLIAVVALDDLEVLEKLEDRLLAEKCERILADPSSEWLTLEEAEAELKR